MMGGENPNTNLVLIRSSSTWIAKNFVLTSFDCVRILSTRVHDFGFAENAPRIASAAARYATEKPPTNRNESRSVLFARAEKNESHIGEDVRYVSCRVAPTFELNVIVFF